MIVKQNFYALYPCLKFCNLNANPDKPPEMYQDIKLLSFDTFYNVCFIGVRFSGKTNIKTEFSSKKQARGNMVESSDYLNYKRKNYPIIMFVTF